MRQTHPIFGETPGADERVVPPGPGHLVVMLPARPVGLCAAVLCNHGAVTGGMSGAIATASSAM
jgi:hypothetical protein